MIPCLLKLRILYKNVFYGTRQYTVIVLNFQRVIFEDELDIFPGKITSTGSMNCTVGRRPLVCYRDKDNILTLFLRTLFGRIIMAGRHFKFLLLFITVKVEELLNYYKSFAARLTFARRFG